MKKEETNPKLVARLNEMLDDHDVLSDNDITELTGMINNRQELEDSLPAIRDAIAKYKADAEKCNGRKREIADGEKKCKERTDALTAVLARIMQKLNFKTVKSGDASVTLMSRVVTKVSDEDALLRPHLSSPEYINLIASLPAYVKVTLTLDKAGLNATLRDDNTMLLEHPELVHTEASYTVKIK